MGKYFGTDGIRGVAGRELRAETAFRVGKAAALALTGMTNHKPVIMIGKDTRISSDMLEAALVAGVTSVGADVVVTGVMPTPAVAYLTHHEADAGIVISASHNTFEYNGIKIFDHRGFKLPDAVEDEIEQLMERESEPKTGAAIGRVRYDRQAAGRYAAYLASLASGETRKLRVVADCANGAASATARALFSRMGLPEPLILSDEPNGVNINDRCGSTHMERLRERVMEGGFDIGLAFDGDADRCLAVDELGELMDGDKIMAVCAARERELGLLHQNTIVTTVMSNLGFYRWAEKKGFHAETVRVGDRYVLERMLEGDFSLGGEQSGHVIFLRHATTGDGQLTAIKLMDALAASGKPLSALSAEISIYPQVLLGVTVEAAQKDAIMESEALQAAVRQAESTLGEEGRVLVRPSGTEALIRVMLEGKDKAEIQKLAEDIAASIPKA